MLHVNCRFHYCYIYIVLSIQQLIKNIKIMCKKSKNSNASSTSASSATQFNGRQSKIRKPYKYPRLRLKDSTSLRSMKKNIKIAELTAAKSLLMACLIIRALISAFKVGQEVHLLCLHIINNMCASKAYKGKVPHNQVSIAVFVYSCHILRKSYKIDLQFLKHSFEIDIGAMGEWIDIIKNKDATGINILAIIRNGYKTEEIISMERQLLLIVTDELDDQVQDHLDCLQRFQCSG